MNKERLLRRKLENCIEKGLDKILSIKKQLDIKGGITMFHLLIQFCSLKLFDHYASPRATLEMKATFVWIAVFSCK